MGFVYLLKIEFAELFFLFLNYAFLRSQNIISKKAEMNKFTFSYIFPLVTVKLLLDKNFDLSTFHSDRMSTVINTSGAEVNQRSLIDNLI